MNEGGVDPILDANSSTWLFDAQEDNPKFETIACCFPTMISCKVGVYFYWVENVGKYENITPFFFFFGDFWCMGLKVEEEEYFQEKTGVWYVK